MEGPADILTTGGLAAATALAAAATWRAGRRVMAGGEVEDRVERALVGAVTALTGALFVYRAMFVHNDWVPLQSHVDGLVLLTTLVGATIAYLQWTRRLPGVSVFAMPAWTLMLLWGVCASWWTWRPWEIHGVWRTVHLFSVYAGGAAVTLAAAAGGLYLFVDRQLKRKDYAAERFRMLGRLASLETIEAGITGSATAGFVLLTLGLVTGTVIVTGGPTRLGEGWWHTPKVVLAAATWVVFALVMHVRFAPVFRGRRAAVLSIVGFVLLAAVLGIAQRLEGPADGSALDRPRLLAPLRVAANPVDTRRLANHHDRGGTPCTSSA